MTPLLLPVSYDLPMIALSWVVSGIGAFTALSAIGRARQSNTGRVDRFNVLLAGIALGGVGIWSMHFIGMIAWKVDLGVGYRLFETMVSLVAAVIVSSMALGYVAHGASMRRLLVAGPLAGIGVTVMHYLGMYSMRFHGFFEWNWGVVGLSALIAMTAATVALWLAFNLHKRWHRVVAAQVMATAVCTMHYTGMAAASVICTTANRKAYLPDLMRPSDLPALVLTIALGVALMIGTDLTIQRMSSERSNAGRPGMQGAGH
ncbi:MAG TPA: MHYT domain-containing protein [Burkholderiaceae bacterium]|nr:MHYT domain-containing protein [Burkholderiaceae bacterium]